MIDYEPNNWVIIKLGTIYKVFGIWHSEWRINSGIEYIEEFEDYFLFYGYSKSVYKCWKNSYGMNTWGLSIIDEICINTNSELLTYNDFLDINIYN